MSEEVVNSSIDINSFTDISMTKNFTSHSVYGLTGFIRHCWKQIECHGLIVNPDFRRNSTWLKSHRINYVESVLSGEARHHSPIIFSGSGIDAKPNENLYFLLDGYNRYTSLLDFIRDDFSAFGYKYSQLLDEYDCGKINVEYKEFNSVQEIKRWYRLHHHCTLPFSVKNSYK